MKRSKSAVFSVRLPASEAEAFDEIRKLLNKRLRSEARDTLARSGMVRLLVRQAILEDEALQKGELPATLVAKIAGAVRKAGDAPRVRQQLLEAGITVAVSYQPTETAAPIRDPILTETESARAAA